MHTLVSAGKCLRQGPKMLAVSSDAIVRVAGLISADSYRFEDQSVRVPYVGAGVWSYDLHSVGEIGRRTIRVSKNGDGTCSAALYCKGGNIYMGFTYWVRSTWMIESDEVGGEYDHALTETGDYGTDSITGVTIVAPDLF